MRLRRRLRRGRPFLLLLLMLGTLCTALLPLQDEDRTAMACVAVMVAGILLLFDPELRRARRRIVALVRRRAHLRQRLLLLRDEGRAVRANLRAAGRIQRSLLPRAPTGYPEVEFAWAFVPCAELGGDMLDIVPLDDTRVGVFLLDVAGHGLDAALLAVSLSRTLSQGGLLKRAPAAGGPPELVRPGRVITRLNRLFPQMTSSERFLTLCYGILDTATGEFAYSLGGHASPLLVSRHRVQELAHAGGPVVGVFEEAEYAEARVVLLPGDRIFLMSDGLEEARRSDGEAFGPERAARTLWDYRGETMHAAIAGLLQAAREHAGRRALKDDFTILAFGYRGPQGS